MIHWFLIVTISVVEQIKLLVCSVTIVLLLSLFLLIGILGIIVCAVLVNCNSFCLRT
jgi:hypothetical protein